LSPIDRYRELAPHDAELPLCFQPWYLDAVCAEGSWDVALVEENGKIAGVWTWFKKSFLGIPYITMPHFTKWMGPWLHPDRRGRLTEDIERLEIMLGQLPSVVKLNQHCHPEFQNWLPLYWQGFQQTTRYTYILVIDDLEQVQAGFNRSVRRNIKKGDTLLKLEERQSLPEFYRMLGKSFERQSLSLPYGYPLFERHILSLIDHNAVKLFWAVDEEGRLHGVSVLTWDKHRAYYHLGGDDPLFRESGVGQYLTWKAMVYAHQHLPGRIFDFQGSMLKGVEVVRRNFGAVQEPYFSIRKGPFGQFRLPG
jgi:hypothetical protein